MEFYTYVNIFETKGLEYLLLMSFFVLFVLLLRYLSGADNRGVSPEKDGGVRESKRAAMPESASRGR